MNLLTITNLSKQLGERLLFSGADLLINEGDRVGLIGVNGSGKSTLLRIVAGLEAADDGEVTVWGGVRVEYLAQDPELDDANTVLDTIFASSSPQMQQLRSYEEASAALEKNPHDSRLQSRLAALSAEMEQEGGWAAEANAKSILTQLGIDNFEARVGTLSGGQRKRVALARVLIDRADLLVLDEPTNHIDASTITWLEDYLATTPGALLMVTHDRYFLDRIVNRIVELDRRQLVSYSGNYTRYLEERERRDVHMAQAEAKRQKLLRRELEWVRRSPMARGTKQKARRQRVEELLQIRYDRGDDAVMIAMAGRRLGTKVLTANNLKKRFDASIVVDGVDLRLEPGDRIGIVGPNGAGKSTLLDLLAGKIEPDDGSFQWGETVQVGYYDQRSADLDDRKRLIEFVEEEAPLVATKDGDRIEAAQMLEWFLFPRAMQWSRIGSLSGGERRRLYLLRTLIHQPNVLMLDEPTNDLDIQTLTVLEEFLDHFRGCLIVVSHDRYFLDRTVDYLIYMEQGKLGPRLPAPYSLFERMRSEMSSDLSDRDAGNLLQAGDRTKRSSRKDPDHGGDKSSAVRKLSWREKRELETLEGHVTRLESNRTRLLDEINSCGEDYVRLQTLAGELESAEADLEAALSRWFELSAIAEAEG